MELPNEPKPPAILIEFVSFVPLWEESEAEAKQRIATLVHDGYEIVSSAGTSAPGGEDQLQRLVTVVLQRKPPKLAWVTET